MSLHDQLVAKVREMIVDGELQAGAAMPERMLCETFGVSRTPLREAFFRARAVANYDARRWTESVKEHEAFMAFLRARDAPRFAAALSAHTRKTGDAVLSTSKTVDEGGS